MTRGLHLIVTPKAVGTAWSEQISQSSWATNELWNHQQFLADEIRRREFLLVASGMGTGKSQAALAGLGLRDRPIATVLLTGNESNATKERRLRDVVKRAVGEFPGIVVVNYEAVYRGRLGTLISSLPWASITLDESHRAKAPAGKASRYLANLARKNPKAKRVCLTGTPMPKDALDVYGQFRFLDPSILGTSFARFRSRIAKTDPRYPSRVIEWTDLKPVEDALRDHAILISSESVLDLPPVQHIRIEVDLSKKTRHVYESMKKTLVAQIEAGEVTAANAAVRTGRLRQIVGGSAYIGLGNRQLIDGTPDKIKALEELLEGITRPDPLVVFCEYRADLEEVAAAARRQGRVYAEVSGSKERGGLGLEEWQAGEAEVLGVQLRSGAEGIDLTRACYAAYYSVPWTVGAYEQSIKRLVRPGQTRSVRFYHLVARNTIDAIVYKALRSRRSVIESVLEGLSGEENAYV